MSYITVHSLLGLKPQVSHSGEIEYVRDATQPQKIDDKPLLILDEVSMLNDELFELIYKHVQLTGLKVIFLGDGAQIPPVKSKG
ncbi:AAA family ATPase, partial [Pseudomonas neuropathica]|uniref:AAA family ATPase n=1 Tax=Pseudomonas neuropathica TaxID=2730425 RepID=UPI0034D56241